MNKNDYEGITGTYYTPEGYFLKEKEVEDFDTKFSLKESNTWVTLIILLLTI